MFLRNCWYVAAWAHELDDGLLARTILGEPVVIYRDADGATVALEDSCAHRQAPLSLGAVTGRGLQCPYHGLVFDRTGACVHVPGQANIPEGARVKSYPVVEKWRWVWIWMGDAALADAALVPDFHWNDDPGWIAVGDYFPLGGGYRLLVENLLDLSHVTYVHASTLGSDAVAEFPVDVRRRDGGLQVDRWILDAPPPPMFATVGGFTGNVDRWQLIHYLPPGHFVIDVGCAVAGSGAPDGDRSHGIEMYSNHSVTPETERSSHYFWHHARNFRRDEPELTQAMAEATRMAFYEDVVLIEAQQKRLDCSPPDRPVIDLNADAGPLQGRRLLDALIAAEHKSG